MSFDREFEHRDRLLAAAIAEFADRGYERASINGILAAAGMSKGQLYHHFGNKEGLYLAVVEQLIRRKRAHFTAHPPPTGDDFFDTLRAQLLAGCAFARAHPELERFSRSFLAERGRPIFATVGRRFGLGRDEGLRSLVTAAHARGDFREELPLDFVQRTVAVYFENLPEILDLQDPADVAAGVDEIVAFLRRGLGRRPREAPPER